MLFASLSSLVFATVFNVAFKGNAQTGYVRVCRRVTQMYLGNVGRIYVVMGWASFGGCVVVSVLFQEMSAMQLCV